MLKKNNKTESPPLTKEACLIIGCGEQAMFNGQRLCPAHYQEHVVKNQKAK